MPSWKPVVKVGSDEKFYDNALRFATRDEALRNAKDLMARWTSVVECGVEASDDPVNYVFSLDGKLIPSGDKHF